MSFKTRSVYDIGSEVDLHCKFGAEWVQFRALVRRAGEDSMGVEFIDVEAAHIAVLSRWIDQLRQSR